MNKFNSSCTSRVPFLTIGIASYNYAEYLPLAFEQIKKQSFTDYEVLYCDDGSTDGSTEIILGFIRDNPTVPIRLISGTNAGILANRNRILENAQGKYLMICDADDYMLENCLSRLCMSAVNTDADCIIGGFQEVDEAGYLLKKHQPPDGACKWLYTWHHAQIYKTELFRQYSIRFEELPDDVFFLQQIHQHSKKTVFVSETLYTWVRHTASVSNNTMTHPEWNPVEIWQKLSHYTSILLSTQQTDNDQNALIYYLYKWFYFNIGDLPTANSTELKHSIFLIKKQMLTVCPKYRALSVLCPALKTADSIFAHFAVFLCWLLDKVGMLSAIAYLRTTQAEIRRLRRHHGSN